MKSSFTRILIIGFFVIGPLTTGIPVNARNVSRYRNPNLAAAQTFVEKAINKVSDAQSATNYAMDGHAAKAKALLDQAYAEIKLAAEAYNQKR